jgi:hypothetical protein
LIKLIYREQKYLDTLPFRIEQFLAQFNTVLVLQIIAAFLYSTVVFYYSQRWSVWVWCFVVLLSILVDLAVIKIFAQFRSGIGIIWWSRIINLCSFMSGLIWAWAANAYLNQQDDLLLSVHIACFMGMVGGVLVTFSFNPFTYYVLIFPLVSVIIYKTFMFDAFHFKVLALMSVAYTYLSISHSQILDYLPQNFHHVGMYNHNACNAHDPLLLQFQNIMNRFVGS